MQIEKVANKDISLEAEYIVELKKGPCVGHKVLSGIELILYLKASITNNIQYEVYKIIE